MAGLSKVHISKRVKDLLKSTSVKDKSGSKDPKSKKFVHSEQFTGLKPGNLSAPQRSTLAQQRRLGGVRTPLSPRRHS